MIVVDKNYMQITISLPVNFTKSNSNYKFLLENTVSHKSYSWDVIDSNQDPWSYFFVINIEEALPVGEYEYRVKDSSFEVVATGLLKVATGDTPKVIVENPVEFEVYEDTAEGMIYTETVN